MTFICVDNSVDAVAGSSGRVRGAEKHEIYVAAFGGHLFYDLFLAPSAPPPGVRYCDAAPQTYHPSTSLNQPDINPVCF